MARRRRGYSLFREITAYHEAAHAVMAFRFGYPVHVVALCDQGPYAGYVAIPPGRQLIHRAIRNPRFSASWATLVRDTERWAMVYLAGPVAAARLMGMPMRVAGNVSDFQQCLLLCGYLNRYRKRCVRKGANIKVIDPGELANRLRRRTATILGRPEVWRAVSYLAHELIGWSRLSGPDAADAAAFSQRVRNQVGLMLEVPAK